MTFLAPWALALGVVAAAGAVLLHLVSRQRPAAYLLPTARFIPDQRTLVRRLATRPRDLVLLALRVIVLLAAAAAFARPVLAPARHARARIMLLDRSAAVADPGAAVARVRALAGDGVPARLVLFDSAVVVADRLSGDLVPALDSLARISARATDQDTAADTAPRPTRISARDATEPTQPRQPAPQGSQGSQGSLSAALVAARRLAPSLARGADSVELVLLSPVLASELDAATDSIRATWPGAIVIERLAARETPAAQWTLARAVGADDVLGPSLADVPAGAAARSVRLRRVPLVGADSAVARAGGAVVAWDESARVPVRAEALVAGDNVVVASLRRGELRPREGERAIARWADGAPAAVESSLGAGCIRRVAVGIPEAGDLPLRAAFRQIVRGLMAPCVGVAGGAGAGPTLADAGAMARLAGTSRAAAAGTALEGRDRPASAIVPWLLGVALAAALTELVVRARPRAAEAA